MRRVAGALVVIAIPASAWARGEPCGARSDCAEPLRCVHNACVDATELVTTAPERVAEPIDGAFIGGSIGLALPATWKTGGEGFTLAFRTGYVTSHQWQLALDVSPGTLLLNQGPSPLGLFDAVVTVGGLVHVGDMVSWILRVGVGGGLVVGKESPSNIAPRPPLGFVEMRADLFGVAIHTGRRTMLEITAPSFRAIYFPSWSNDLLYMFVINVAYDRFL